MEKCLKIISTLLESREFWYGIISCGVIVLFVFLLTRYVTRHHPKYKKLENDDLKFKEFLKRFAKENNVEKNNVAHFFRINLNRIETLFSLEENKIINTENIQKIIEDAIQEYQQSK
ncbi:MAG: hypothetical protein WCO35_00550 [Candidatus Nomurabacteria bacterium]